METHQRKGHLSRLGSRIRALRAKVDGMSLARLCAETGIAPSYLSRVERGHIDVRISTLIRISKALNVTLPDLCSYEDPNAEQID